MGKKMLSKLRTKKVFYLKKDIFESTRKIVSCENKSYNIVIPHVCNNINLFGAGFAHHVGKNYPMVKENFHLLGKKSYLGYTQFVSAFVNPKTNSQIIFANMIAQNKTISVENPRPLNYAALTVCMTEVKRYIDNIKLNNDVETSIHAPKFGSGLAGGNWSFIECLIQDIWHNTTTFIYYL
jgi:hypothetical protein